MDPAYVSDQSQQGLTQIIAPINTNHDHSNNQITARSSLSNSSCPSLRKHTAPHSLSAASIISLLRAAVAYGLNVLLMKLSQAGVARRFKSEVMNGILTVITTTS
jgi:hypothetical protein